MNKDAYDHVQLLSQDDWNAYADEQVLAIQQEDSLTNLYAIFDCIANLTVNINLGGLENA